jgi:hypothetical protein
VKDNELSKNKDKVITVLKNPKSNYIWRTIGGLCEDTGLSHQQVREALSKLMEDGRVIKSTVPSINRRSLYKVNPAEILMEQASKVPSGDTDQKEVDRQIEQSIDTLIKLSNPEQTTARLQQQLTFFVTLIIAIVGFIFLLYSVIVSLITPLQTATIITAIGGVITEVIAGLFLTFHNQNTAQVTHYFRQEERLRYIQLANSICQTLSKDNKEKARLDLISKMTTYGSRQTDEKP